MKQVILEGILGEKFGYEWNLDVNSPAEALSAIMAQRPGMRQFIAQGEGVQGYEIIIGDDHAEVPEELLLNMPGKGKYTFVPVIGGSKSSALMMVMGVALIAMTGGMGAGLVPGFMGTVGSAATAGSAAVAATATTAAVAAVAPVAAVAASGVAGAIGATGMAAMSYLGTGLLLGGAAMMLAPDVPDGNSSEKAENYLFGGPVNTVKQGQPIPLVYGRAIVGSKTISASLFTNTSRQKLTAGRKMVGIPNFRTDGSKSGQNNNTTTNTPGMDIGHIGLR
jgi:predicted phage tail protein